MTTSEAPPQRSSLPATAASLAAIGNEAAHGTDLDQLLDRACAEVAELMRVGFAKVLEYLPEERRLFVRAGHGWADGVVGVARLEADLGSPAGYALQTGQPTLANDLGSEQRFKMPELLRKHGVVCAVNVIIRSGDLIFGVLEADSREPCHFDERDVEFLQGYANILALAIAQQRLAAEKLMLTQRAEMLLTELRHRTKNNNQLLLSLLRLKRSRHAQLETRQALDEVAGHVTVLSQLDELIFSAGGEGRIDLGNYLVTVMTNVLQVEASRRATLRLHTELAEAAVDSRRAQALAMIVNEFVTNSLKHGLGEGGGELTMSLKRADGGACLELRDDGPGFPEEAERGVGMRLITAMAEAVNGEASWVPGGGACLRVTFPLDG